MAPQIPPHVPNPNPHRARVQSGLRNEVQPDRQPLPIIPQAQPATLRDPRIPIAMPPFGRPVPAHGNEVEFPPLRPHSPTGAYVPDRTADPATEARHREMANHKYATFMDHPDAPMTASGGLKLGKAYADALLGFRAQVRSMPDQSQRYVQTYRAQDGAFHAVHAQPVKGVFGEVAMPSGSYPPGTGLVILSHPAAPGGFGQAARPEAAEMLRAYQDRTNALRAPGSETAMHILYDAGSDQAFAFDGRLGHDGNPKFFHATIPEVSQVRTEAILPQAMPPAPRHASVAAAPDPVASASDRFIPGHELISAEDAAILDYFSPHGLLTNLNPRPGESGSASHPIDLASTPSAPASPKWDEWMDFNPGASSHPSPEGGV